jgi:hypothetical protein
MSRDRRPLARIMLAVSAFSLGIGGTIHARALPTAAEIADHSSMPHFFAAAFKGLWLCDSINSIALALVFSAIAVVPRIASGVLVMLLACMPLGTAVGLFASMGNFPPGYVMLAAGGAALVGGSLMRRQTSAVAG